MIVNPKDITSPLELWWYRDVEKKAIHARQPTFTFPGEHGSSHAYLSIQFGLQGWEHPISANELARRWREAGDKYLAKKGKGK